jgi:pentatricopeptide repeat protein
VQVTQGNVSNNPCIAALLQIYCRLGQWSQASGLVREMLHKGLAPQEALWHICFRHLVWADAAATVVAEFLSLMEPQERHRFEQLYKLQSGRAEVQEAERQQQQALREQQQRAEEGPVAQAAAEAYA